MKKNYNHIRENNSESENHLADNEEHFNKQCKQVLSLLRQGKVLTQRIGMIEYDIGDTRRRISDLVAGGIKGIKDEWILDANGKITKCKKWFMPEFLKHPTNIVYKKNEKASSDYSKELIKSTSRKKQEPVHNPLFDNLKFD